MSIHYPETSLIVELAKTVWSGGLNAGRVDFSLSSRLKSELNELMGRVKRSVGRKILLRRISLSFR